MATPRTPADALAAMHREMQTCLGPVPHCLDGFPVAPGYHRIGHDGLLLRTESGLGFYYRRGKGVTIERRETSVEREIELWLNGTVYAGVASLNGLMPLHASAVACDGQVVAFTGPAGAGKSTLAAGLGRLGYPLFCDDTLLIDLQGADPLICLPGHKRLKLRPDALALTGADRLQEVGAETGKYYAAPTAGTADGPLPLGALVFLADAAVPSWEPITGADRFGALEDDHYTQDLYAWAVRPSLAQAFATRARIAGQVAMARLTRPRCATEFADMLDFVSERLRETAVIRAGAD